MKTYPPVRDALTNDALPISDIYNYYITQTIITFETEVVSEGDIIARMSSTALPWLVFEENEQVLGYAYATTWKSRAAYFQTVESSVYVRQDSFGKQIGPRLYEELLRRLRTQKIHAVIGGIALPNETSIKLHESFGFEKIGHFREVGFKFGKRIDVGYWEKLL